MAPLARICRVPHRNRHSNGIWLGGPLCSHAEDANKPRADAFWRATDASSVRFWTLEPHKREPRPSARATQGAGPRERSSVGGEEGQSASPREASRRAGGSQVGQQDAWPSLSLADGPSTPLARQVAAKRAPLLGMRSDGRLLACIARLPRLLSVGKCPNAATRKANTEMMKRLFLANVRHEKPAIAGHAGE
jgi:hypothetical protein